MNYLLRRAVCANLLEATTILEQLVEGSTFNPDQIEKVREITKQVQNLILSVKENK